MSDMSSYLGDKLLNWIKGTAFGTAPTTVYAALYNGDPDSGGTEVTGTVGLTRQAVSWGAVSSRSVSSNADITFGTASGSATATFVVLYDSSTSGAGNQLSKKSISSASITSGETVTISSGNLTLTY